MTGIWPAVPILVLALAGGRERPPAGVSAEASAPAESTASCAGATALWVAAHRPGIPNLAAPPSDCAAPGLLPIRLEALVVDGLGQPVPGCQVTFFTDTAQLPFCARSAGAFCPTGSIATTDIRGVAEATYVFTQADLDSCNCYYHACDCLEPGSPGDCDPGTPGTQTGRGWCPQPAACSSLPTCTTSPSQDLWCAVAFRARAGALTSFNEQFVEYGR